MMHSKNETYEAPILKSYGTVVAVTAGQACGNRFDEGFDFGDPADPTPFSGPPEFCVEPG